MRPEGRASLVAAAIAAAASVCTEARADEPAAAPASDLVVVVDPELGQETGVRTLTSAGRLALRYDEAMPVLVPHAGAALATTGRALELGFVDLPLSDFFSTVIHEAFGHGARGREFHRGPTYQLSLPAPYRQIFSPDDHADHSASTEFTRGGGVTTDEALLTTLGGIEANLATAHLVDTQIVARDGRVRRGDLLLYFAKLDYVTSFFSGSLRRLDAGAEGGNDVTNYVTLLQDRFDRWRPEDRTSIARKLATGYAWNLIDPTLLFAVYGVVRFVVTGEREITMPLPRAAGVTFYPTPRFGVTPFGGEQIVDLFLARGGAVLDLYGRFGTSGLATYDGAGARLVGWRPVADVALGAEVDAWTQPETLFGVRSAYDRAQVLGGNVGAYATWYVAGPVGVTAKLALKSRGYLESEPIAAGPYGYVGAAVRGF